MVIKDKRQSLQQRNMLLNMRLNSSNPNLSNHSTAATAVAGNNKILKNNNTSALNIMSNATSSSANNGSGINKKNELKNKLWRMSFSPKSKPMTSTKNTTLIGAGSKRSPVAFVGSYPMKDLKFCDFEIGKKLGKGKFGKVYCCRHIKTGFICAIKIMDKSEILTYNVTKQFRNEIEIQSNLNHENLTKLYGFFHDSKRVYLIMEYIYNGELYSILKKNGPFNDIVASNFVFQLTNAIRYLHKKRIIHRDLKPENILIDFNNVIKITDFGWSVYNEAGNKRKTLCGTIDYLSPELINSKEYDGLIDVWALGIIAYELIVGTPPFEEDTKELTYKRIKNCDLNFPAHVSQDAKNLISSLLKLNPSERITLTDVLKHPWINKNKPFW
ncbi:hypothetical protein TPHA_0E02820 [Tetrapisispora phaffii CBS 4417]|uniref:Aurora kinase n=1 Tax=Tetrapisispora phaffii (strain ATCC 24235 / CBS 4417 / NBRC 1672 / NRRL Y-8282 / UCD 70-5) TaxID=1071381 RepID=G8BTZ4_TETPH|nr:hypothetical protein TPHA_0E02820 [Tetrapisispora phaffii CBS 4417]CCE63372.1 hypothetical protein TPHA_0E02820 [Tetrapisispora phaffii CBS 4417]